MEAVKDVDVEIADVPQGPDLVLAVLETPLFMSRAPDMEAVADALAEIAAGADREEQRAVIRRRFGLQAGAGR